MARPYKSKSENTAEEYRQKMPMLCCSWTAENIDNAFNDQSNNKITANNGGSAWQRQERATG